MADLVVLPEAPPPTMKLLHELLHSGVESTLREAENQDVLEPPYGRKVANPLPKTDDEDELDADDPWADVEDEEDEDGEEDGEEEEEEPKFEFAYGFNALKFLGEYLKTNNPKAVRERAIERQKQLLLEAKQAEVSRVISETFEYLKSKVYTMRSGVALGPMCSNVSSVSATLWVKTAVPGQVIFEVFHDEAYNSIFETHRVASSAALSYVASATFENLQSNTTYFYRVCVRNDDLQMPGPDGGFFSNGAFTSQPEHDDNASLSFCTVGAPAEKASTTDPPSANPWTATCDSIVSAKPMLVVVSGGVLPRTSVRSIKTTVSAQDKVNIFSRLYAKQLGDIAIRRLLSSQVVLFGLNDDSNGSAMALRTEETAMEEKKEETPKAAKKSKKGKRQGLDPAERKLDEDPRGDITPAMMARKLHLPLEVEDVMTRHTYSRSRYGRRADFFLLDTRGGVLGKTQTAWLNRELAASGCTWKFIVVQSMVSFETQPAPPPGSKGSNGRRSSKDKKKQSKSDSKDGVEVGTGDKAVQQNEVAGADKSAEGYITVADTIDFIVSEGITGVVFLTSDEQQLSVIRCSPKLTAEQLEAGQPAPLIHSFGIGPLGPSNQIAASVIPARKNAVLKPLRPEFLISQSAEVPSGGATFGKVDVSAGGSLTYTVHDDSGATLHSLTIESSW